MKCLITRWSQFIISVPCSYQVKMDFCWFISDLVVRPFYWIIFLTNRTENMRSRNVTSIPRVCMVDHHHCLFKDKLELSSKSHLICQIPPTLSIVYYMSDCNTCRVYIFQWCPFIVSFLCNWKRWEECVLTCMFNYDLD